MMVFAVNKQKVVLSCDLHCQGCCDKIMKNIAFEKGVKDIVCDLKTKTVTVTYDADKTDVPTLLKAFEKIGKPAQVKDDKAPKKEPPLLMPIQEQLRQVCSKRNIDEKDTLYPLGGTDADRLQ